MYGWPTFSLTSWVWAAPQPYKPVGGQPVDRPLGAFKSIQITPKNFFKKEFEYFFGCAKGACRKKYCKRIPPSVQGHLGAIWIFEFSQNYSRIPPFGGSTQNKLFEVTHRARMPNLVEIHPIKNRTNKQSNRRTPLLYNIYR